MTTYRLLNDVQNCHEAFIDFKAFRRQFNGIKVWFPQENTSLLDKLNADWIPVPVSFSSDKKNNSIPDISVWNLSCLVLSDRANTLLRPSLENFGEFLPLEQGFHVFNCLASVGNEVIEASGTSYLIEGSDGGNALKTLQLKPAAISRLAIFKPGFSNNGFLICQDDLKNITIAHNLSGVTFEENLGGFAPI